MTSPLYHITDEVNGIPRDEFDISERPNHHPNPTAVAIISGYTYCCGCEWEIGLERDQVIQIRNTLNQILGDA